MRRWPVLFPLLIVTAGEPAHAATSGPAAATNPAVPVTAATLPTGDGSEFHATMLGWSVAPPPPVAADGVLNLPVAATRISSRFGARVDPLVGDRRRHLGIDIPGAWGTAVHAAADGVVRYAGRAGGYGILVEIDHPGLRQTRYGHLAQAQVGLGDIVHGGDVIGFMGSTGRSTGPHLHFEVRLQGQAADPLQSVGQPFTDGGTAAAVDPTVHWAGFVTTGRTSLPLSSLR